MHKRDFMAGGAAAAMLASLRSAEAATPAPANPSLPAEFLPREVRIKASFAPGEIHVDPNNFALYWTMEGRKAIRYTIGIGRPGLYESGEFYVGRKAEWPSWTPTPDMIRRNPGAYARHANGMPGGPNNPLGARALYLYTPARGDTYLRIHGTNAPRTIAHRVSNGCARLVNEHIVQLYEMVPTGTRVVLYNLATG